MKHVAYNFELDCFGVIGHGGVGVGVDARLFFKTVGSDVILTSFIDALDDDDVVPKFGIHSFDAFNSSLFPIGIAPNRFGIALKFATAFISSGIGMVRFCGVIESLFK